MPKRRKKSPMVPRLLVVTCIVSGIATLVLRMANDQLKTPALAKIGDYAGTAFVICLVIIIGIYVLKYINRK